MLKQMEQFKGHGT